MSNIITAHFAPGETQIVTEQTLPQWAYGQILKIEGVELQANYQVDFSNFEFYGVGIPQLGTSDGVTIPKEVLFTGKDVYAFFWTLTENSGKRLYRVTIPVIPGPAPGPDTPSPEDQTIIQEAITALNAAADNYVPIASMAPAFDTSKNYPAGTYVWYSGQLYLFMADHAAGAWTGADAIAVKIASELEYVKTGSKNSFSLGDYVDMTGLQITEGKYISSDGSIASNGNLAYSDYIEVPDGVQSVTVNRYVYTPDGTLYIRTSMVAWYDSSKNFLSFGSANETSGNLITSNRPGTDSRAKYIRVNLALYNVESFIKFNYFPALKFMRSVVTVNDSLNDLNEPGVYYIADAVTSGKPTGVTAAGWLFVTQSPWTGSSTAGSQIFITRYRTYFRTKSSNTWRAWYTYPSADEIKNEVEGAVGTYSGIFTEGHQILSTEINLKANTSYYVKCYSPRTGAINVYASGHSSVFKRLTPYDNELVYKTGDWSANLNLYNIGDGLDSVEIAVFEIGSIKEKSEKVPRTYRVTKTASTGDYTSLSKCLFDLKNDDSPKIIEIWEGDYDIYQEYVELYNAGLLEIYTGDDPTFDYFNYCVWVPKNTHIVGKGIVRLKWMPDPAVDDITPNQCKCVSPLNVAATCTIENVEVYCKNGRYCLHNDGLGKEEFTGAIQKYINVRFYKYANDTVSGESTEYGWKPTIGFGIDRAMHHVYENCTFINYAEGRAFYGHSRIGAVSTEAENSDISLINCVMDTEGARCVKFGNSGTASKMHIRVIFSSCYFSSAVYSINESSSSQTTARNAFDMQFLNCGDVSLHIEDPDNPYPPKAYRTTITTI